ncbi:MAG: MBL fold metallo-hydrolase [Bacteroides sp.]|nr:MBL fold metallo-hydrolase [Bacteroides sp.]
MNRRDFLKVSSASVMAMGTTQAAANIFVPSEEKEEGMAIRFLGTGAADWNGRDNRGELRRLSSILVDKKVLFDFTASNIEMLPSDCKPETVFYTHSHKDHYHPESALKIGIKTVYLSQTWHDIAKSDFKQAADKLNMPMPEIIPLYIGQAVHIGNLKITPLPASHATSNTFEQTLIYLLEKSKARVMYATDTAGIPAVAARLAGIDAHDRNGKPITGLIMEATMGMEHNNDYRIFTHSSVGMVQHIVEVLQKTKRYSPISNHPVYLTHMARTLHGTQAELDASLPYPLKAAHDGLEVTF